MKVSDLESIKEKTATELRLFTLWKNYGQEPRSSGDNVPDKSLKGCFAALVPRFLNFFVRLGLDKEATDRKHVEREELAKALLEKDIVLNRLCSKFLNFGPNKILMEKDVVEIVVETFGDEDLTRELKVSLEPVLLAIISYEILRTGVNDLCAYEQTTSH